MRWRSPMIALAFAAWSAAAAAAACGDDTEAPPAAPDAGAETATPPPADAADAASPFGLDVRPANATCKAPPRPPSGAKVRLERVYAGLALDMPMALAKAPGDPSRWFAALRAGKVVSFPATAPATATVVADLQALSGIAVDTDVEAGFLGMAFHPAFATNGKLFVTFDGRDPVDADAMMRSHVGVLTSTDGGQSFSRYDDVLAFDQTTVGNHKGGGIAFGLDGNLYVSFGDGGGANDGFYNGQTRTGFFSKVLRLDVDHPSGGRLYGIPAGNPFAQGGGSPEVFAYGFRNPFRLSVDRATGDVLVGDVGQDGYEEVDRAAAGGDYGWPCREGSSDYVTPTAEPDASPPVFAVDPTKCPSMVGLVDPIGGYSHDGGGAAIIGGVVYRGKAMPDLAGAYVFGDYILDAIGTMAFDPVTTKPVTDFPIPGTPVEAWGSFAEDENGEVYAVALSGAIYALVADAAGEPQPSSFPDRLSKTGCVDPADPRKPAPGLVPYAVNAAFWSDGAEKRRWMAIPDGTTITTTTAGHLELPIGTVLVKELALGGKRIETRLFVRHDDGEWGGYSYAWADDESDAVLLASSASKVVGAQRWAFPSRSDCMRCHTSAAGRTLGTELGQLDRDLLYPETNRTANQLATLAHVGMLAPGGAAPPIPDPFGAAPLEARARAWLHANCAQCHRPGGPGGGGLDLRFGTSLHDAHICGVDPSRGDLGIAGAKLVAPGDPARSVLALRAHAPPGAVRMPPLASSVVDTAGTALLDAWIASLAACP